MECFVLICVLSVRPNDIFNPIKVRVNTSINSRYTFCSAHFTKRCHTNDNVHAWNVLIIGLNGASRVSLREKKWLNMFVLRYFFSSVWFSSVGRRRKKLLFQNHRLICTVGISDLLGTYLSDRYVNRRIIVFHRQCPAWVGVQFR